MDVDARTHAHTHTHICREREEKARTWKKLPTLSVEFDTKRAEVFVHCLGKLRNVQGISVAVVKDEGLSVIRCGVSVGLVRAGH